MIFRVVLSSMFLVLLIVSIAANAYDANCWTSADVLGIGYSVKLFSTMNARGLENGMYVLHASIGSNAETIAESYRNGKKHSRGIAAVGYIGSEGRATAFVNGYDPNNGKYHAKSDKATWTPTS